MLTRGVGWAQDGDMADRKLALSDLVPDPRNARLHDEVNLGLIASSLADVGAARSIVIDENRRILAGNGTVAAALRSGRTRVRVVAADGDEIIAVERRDLTEAQKARLALYDNQTAELATWDAGVLAAMRDEGLTEGIFDEADLDAILTASEPQPTAGAGGDDYDVTPAEGPTRSQPGDLWSLGGHRLLCGDSTKPEDVERLMGDERAVLMNTDPPYGVDYSAVKDGIPHAGFRNQIERWGHVENDGLTNGPDLQAFLESAIRAAVPYLTDTCAFYLWHPMLTQGTFFAAAAAAAAADILIHRQIVWVKPHLVLTRSGMYHWRHELCFYGWVRGHMPPWYGDKAQTSVWEAGYDAGANQHPTQKPIALFESPMLNHSRSGEIVYEPFAGSGSQVIAAERLGRRCFAIEVSPRWCDVVISRWEAEAGKEATCLGAAVHAEGRYA